MQCGDLATLLRTARNQQRSYQRANLEEVMLEGLVTDWETYRARNLLSLSSKVHLVCSTAHTRPVRPFVLDHWRWYTLMVSTESAPSQVMREVLAEENTQLAHVSRPRDQGGGRRDPRDRGGGGGGLQKSRSLKNGAGAGGVPPGKKARKERESESLSPLRAREPRGSGLATELSAEYGYPGGSPPHRGGGGGGGMAMPDFVDAEPAGRGGQERSSQAGGKKKTSQILPPYLRGAVPHRSGGGGGCASRPGRNLRVTGAGGAGGCLTRSLRRRPRGATRCGRWTWGTRRRTPSWGSMRSCRRGTPTG